MMDNIPIVDLVMGATISLSATVAWITYVSSWRENTKSRLNMLKTRMFELTAELEHIKPWVDTEYDDDSDVPKNWNNPFWRVLDFPSKHIESINYISKWVYKCTYIFN